MDFGLTEEQRVLRDGIVRFARAELSPGAAQRDRDHEFSRELWQKCAYMGLTGLVVPEAFGGGAADGLTTAIALEALGYGCEDGGLVFSVCAHLLACVVPIVRFGSEEQKARYLPGFCDGSIIAVNAMTEPESGSDAFNLRTRAVADGDGYRINGAKTFSTNGPVADVALTFAMTDPDKGYHGGISAFLVDRDSDGYRPAQSFDKMGLHTSPIGELVFDDVYAGPEQIVGAVGSGANLFTHSMDWERTCLFAAHVGMMERILEKGVEYARTRSQFGKRIGTYQAISHKLADMKIHLEAARLLVYRAAWQLSQGRSASLQAAMAKVFVSESLVRSALDTLQIHGGNGYMVEYEVERLLRDAIGSTLYSGTSEMQRNIIARWIGVGEAN